MSTLPTNLSDLDPGHTAGHNSQNAQINTNSRPATVQTSTHSSVGTLALDANDGHIAIVTVSANITSVTTPTNMVDGLPFLLILLGNGSSSFTADLSNINLNSATLLSNSHVVDQNGVYHINFIKNGSDLWAPAGVLDWSSEGGGGGGSGISHVNSVSTDFTGSSTTAPVFNLPSGYQSGDLLEVYVVTQESSAPGSPATPSGWTQRYTTNLGSFEPNITKLYRIATGSEGSTLTLTGSPSARYHGGAQAYRGVDQTTPYDVTDPAIVYGDQNVDPPSITTVTNNAMVTIIAAANKVGGSAATISSGYTERLNTSVGQDRSIVLGEKLVATAGAEDPGALTWDSNFSSAARTCALRPA